MNFPHRMRLAAQAAVEGMTTPGRCAWCSHVHDRATVPILGTYVDCSMWACPSCARVIDDRPIVWGGSFVPVTVESAADVLAGFDLTLAQIRTLPEAGV